jgi:hypothetical protein
MNLMWTYYCHCFGRITRNHAASESLNRLNVIKQKSFKMLTQSHEEEPQQIPSRMDKTSDV